MRTWHDNKLVSSTMAITILNEDKKKNKISTIILLPSIKYREIYFSNCFNALVKTITSTVPISSRRLVKMHNNSHSDFLITLQNDSVFDFLGQEFLCLSGIHDKWSSCVCQLV